MMAGETMMTGSGGSGQRASGAHRILLTDTNRWPVTARLAIAFHQVGATVGVLCPMPGHPVQKLTCVHAKYRYNGNNPLGSLEAAITDFSPDIIIPACDRGVRYLHRLHDMAMARGEAGRKLASLIEYSLGDPAGYGVITHRFDLLDLARAEGVLVPETVQFRDDLDTNAWSHSPLLPIILKADGTWGGRGVRISPTSESIRSDAMGLTQRPGPLKLFKSLILNRNRDWIICDWRSSTPSIIVQAIIKGRPANCAVVCWQGKVLAGIAVEVVSARGELGPSTVVEVVKGPEMMRAAERIASRLHLSGFFGLDFMIEDHSGAHYLIEMNPRCTPACSLALGEGRDLVSAFWSQISGRVVSARTPRTGKSTIAFFPQAAAEEADASYTRLLESAYQDIPDEDPVLLREFLCPWSERSLAGRMVDRMRDMMGKKRPAAICSFEGALKNRSDYLNGGSGTESGQEKRGDSELSVTKDRDPV